MPEVLEKGLRAQSPVAYDGGEVGGYSYNIGRDSCGSLVVQMQGDHFTQRALGRPQKSSGEDWAGMDVHKFCSEHSSGDT